MKQELQASRMSLMKAIGRAALGRCPRCGLGKLFASYLKPIDCCAVCGEPYGHIRSDDAAPWLTILVAGHIVVPIMLAVERHATWSMIVSMTVWPVFALVLTLLLLPRAKGVLIAVIWFTRGPGSERS